MDRLIFNAAATIAEQAQNRQKMTNELANLSTIGFKKSYDQALRSLKSEGDGFDTRYQVRLYERDLIQLTPGTLIATGRPMDIALEDAAVLGVQAPNGELAFTRRGDLRVNAQGLLENGAGHVVLGANGPITIPQGFDVRINTDGSVYASDPAQAGPQAGQLIDQLIMRDARSSPLMRREDGLFKVFGQPDGADIPQGETLPRLVAQALEGSNVNAIEAMTRMIDHSRTFELQIRAIKEAKSLDESGASMMRQS